MFLVCFLVVYADANICYRYQRAFVNYFEDELVHHGYDWKSVVNDYLFEGNEPMFNSIIADRMYPRGCGNWRWILG